MHRTWQAPARPGNRSPAQSSPRGRRVWRNASLPCVSGKRVEVEVVRGTRPVQVLPFHAQPSVSNTTSRRAHTTPWNPRTLLPTTRTHPVYARARKVVDVLASRPVVAVPRVIAVGYAGELKVACEGAERVHQRDTGERERGSR